MLSRILHDAKFWCAICFAIGVLAGYASGAIL